MKWLVGTMFQFTGQALLFSSLQWMVKVGVECFVNHMILARTRCQINIIIIERMKLKASEYKIGTNRVTFIATLKLHGSSFDCLCHRIELKDGQVD